MHTKSNQLQKEDKSNTKLLIGFFIAFFAIFGIAIFVVFSGVVMDGSGKKSAQYNDKARAQMDEQWCRIIRIAMETAATDAAVANEEDYIPFKEGDGGRISDLSRGGKIYMNSFLKSTKVDDPSMLSENISTSLGRKEGDFSYIWVSDTAVVVYIDNTDKNGSTSEPHTLTSTNCQCIYSGPVELYND
jgi:hypothetical protein